MLYEILNNQDRVIGKAKTAKTLAKIIEKKSGSKVCQNWVNQIKRELDDIGYIVIPDYNGNLYLIREIK